MKKTKHFGLIGFPLEHSFSKRFFSLKFEKEGIDADYNLYELGNIAEFIEIITDIKFSGLNVTIPHKEKIIPFLDELDDTAEIIGAVNVIKFIHKGKKTILCGYNSDSTGFENSLKPYLKPYHKKALILGTGGVSKAIDYVLQKLGIEVTFVSRSAGPGKITYADLDEKVMSNNLIIINASPVGTFPHCDECPDIPYQYLTDKHFLFDCVYNPPETLFLKKGREKGAVGINGQAMLDGQAVAAWEIWNS